MAKEWLKELNWDNIGKAANNVTSAATAINAAADQLNKTKITRTTVATTEKTSGGDNSAPLLLAALAFLFFGK